MPNLTKAALDSLQQASYQAGYNAGLSAGRKLEASQLNTQRIEAFVKLTNSVGQTMDTQARLLQGLAGALDNAGGIR
jgi:hypothetical protein